MNDRPQGQSDAAPVTDPGVTDLGVTDLGGRHRAAVGFVFAVAVMDILAMGIIIPVLPQLVKQFNHGDTAAAARYFGASS